MAQQLEGWGTEKSRRTKQTKLLPVTEIAPNEWRVEGDKRHQYSSYNVWLEGQRLVCDCHKGFYNKNTGLWQEGRRSCSHTHSVNAYIKDQQANIRPRELNSNGDIWSNPSHIEWGTPPLPQWVTEFRPNQIQAVQEIIAAFDSGKQVVMLNAPTGTGKTLIAEMVRRVLRHPATYLVGTKTLQDQIGRDFDYARVLKGRVNYPPELGKQYGGFDVTCADCPGATCRMCRSQASCPYTIAKKVALESEVAVLNYSYWLSSVSSSIRYQKKIEVLRPLIICDEADLMESEMMSHVTLTVPRNIRTKLKIEPPATTTSASSWLRWIHEVQHKVETALERVEKEGDKEPDDVRYERQLKNLHRSSGYIAEGLATDNIVYKGKKGEDRIEFGPIEISDYTNELFWDLTQASGKPRILLMSATLISAQITAETLGIPDGEWAAVNVESTFDPARHPIHVVPTASMTYKTKHESIPKVVAQCEKILAKHPNQRTLIHSVSYELKDALLSMNTGGRPTMSYSNANERETTLASFINTPGAVLIAPSLDRGVDLPGDKCEVIIIPKVPFPNTSDKQISARLYKHGGQQWYVSQAVRTLVQMSGRGMRSADDTCTTYILDDQFKENVFMKHSQLLPNWWKRALIWHRREE